MKLSLQKTQQKHILSKTHYSRTEKSKTEIIWKATREKKLVINKEIPIRLAGDFSAENQEWDNIFKVLTKKSSSQEYNTWQRCLSETRDKDFPRQTKVEEFHHHETWLKEIQRSSSRWNERTKHMIGHKTSICKFKKIKISLNMVREWKGLTTTIWN